MQIIYIYRYILVYIYIYIYCHPQIDCFIVLQLFRVARHVGCLKLGSKPTQLSVRLVIIPHNQQASHISSGIISHYVVAFICLHFCLVCDLILFIHKHTHTHIYILISRIYTYIDFLCIYIYIYIWEIN